MTSFVVTQLPNTEVFGAAPEPPLGYPVPSVYVVDAKDSEEAIGLAVNMGLVGSLHVSLVDTGETYHVKREHTITPVGQG